MKTKTKALALFLSAVLLVVTTVFTTMAFLTSTDEVTNTFTVGKVKITLDEAKVDEYGNLLDADGKVWEDGKTLANRVTGNGYKLIPGHMYVKDPTVTVVEESEQCYVRMLVTVSNVNVLKEAFPTYVDATTGVFLLQNLVSGWNANVWNYEDYDAKTSTYEFRYYDVVDAREAAVKLPALFTNVVIPGEVDNDTLATLEGETINVVAHAIQADGFQDDDAAWAAWGN